MPPILMVAAFASSFQRCHEQSRSRNRNRAVHAYAFLNSVRWTSAAQGYLSRKIEKANLRWATSTWNIIPRRRLNWFWSRMVWKLEFGDWLFRVHPWHTASSRVIKLLRVNRSKHKRISVDTHQYSKTVDRSIGDLSLNLKLFCYFRSTQQSRHHEVFKPLSSSDHLVVFGCLRRGDVLHRRL